MQVPWIVPRKTYRDFHADIFPETATAQPVMVCSNFGVDENDIKSKYGVFHDRVPAVGPQEGQAVPQPFH